MIGKNRKLTNIHVLAFIRIKKSRNWDFVQPKMGIRGGPRFVPATWARNLEGEKKVEI